MARSIGPKVLRSCRTRQFSDFHSCRGRLRHDCPQLAASLHCWSRQANGECGLLHLASSLPIARGFQVSHLGAQSPTRCHSPSSLIACRLPASTRDPSPPCKCKPAFVLLCFCIYPPMDCMRTIGMLRYQSLIGFSSSYLFSSLAYPAPSAVGVHVLR